MKSDQHMGESCHIKENRLYLGRGRRALQKPPVAAWSDVPPCSPVAVAAPWVSLGRCLSLVTRRHPGKCIVSVSIEVEGPSEPKVCHILSWCCCCSMKSLGGDSVWVLHGAVLWLHTGFTAPEALVIHSSQLKH